MEKKNQQQQRAPYIINNFSYLKTVEGSTCLISKTSLILKPKTNILPNISRLMLDLINCHVMPGGLGVMF